MRKALIAIAALLLATPAQAQTSNTDFKAGLSTAANYCQAVDRRAWSYVGGLVHASRNPVRADFNRAANEIGSQLDDLYSVALSPSRRRRLFRSGWDVGMADCSKKAIWVDMYSK